MSPTVLPVRFRTEAVFLCAIVAGGWIASVVLGVAAPSPNRALAQVGAPSNVDSRQTLSQGDQARRSGDLSEADRLYRLAWRDPTSRSRAAGALRSLERAGYELPVDEAEITKTTDLVSRSFRRFESDHFVLLADTPRAAAVAKLGALERSHDQFFRVMDRLGFEAIPPEHKLLCVLFADHAMYRDFASANDNVNAAWVAGYYAGLSNRAVFYEDDSAPGYAKAMSALDNAAQQTGDLEREATQARRAHQKDRARLIANQASDLKRQIQAERTRLSVEAKQTSISKTIHESIHLLAFNTGVQSRMREYPFWVTEGLATNFETNRPNAAFGPDRPSTLRQDELLRAFETDRALPLRTLVALASPPSDDPRDTEAIYAQSWSLFASLYRTQRRALAGFLNDLLNEPAGRMTDARRVELFEHRFGDIERLEKRWRLRVAQPARTLAATIQRAAN